MDIQRKDAGKKRLIRRIAIGVVLVLAIAGVTVAVSRWKPAAPSVDLSVVWRAAVKRVLVLAIAGVTVAVSRLKPAAPSVDLSVVWRDAVKRGPMTREVRGLGTLVPIDTMLIPATTEGRVQRILIYPGTPVRADSVVMILTSQELETDLLNSEYAMKAAEADYSNLKVTLEKLNLDMQSTVAQVDADFNTAKLQGD